MDDLRNRFLEKLNGRKREFQRALEKLLETQKEYQSPLSNNHGSDESDQAQREISISSNYSLIERKTRELKQIDRLIQKVLRDKSFGRCEECGRQIPAERLLIMPEASLCVHCQRKLERSTQYRGLDSRGALPYLFRKGEDQESFSGLNDLEYALNDSDMDRFSTEENGDNGFTG